METKAEDEALTGALTDVRKAYRLLWAYQKRIHDLVLALAAEFDGMAFYYWQTNHFDRPPNSGTNPLDRWAWRMLPTVNASYLFLPPGEDPNATKAGQWMLEINVDSDSGFRDPEDGNEPDPETFAAPAECSSTISIYAWCCTRTSKLNWFHDVWSKTDWPETDGEPFDAPGLPFRIVGQTHDIASLPDKEAVRRAASEFKTMTFKALGVVLK